MLHASLVCVCVCAGVCVCWCVCVCVCVCVLVCVYVCWCVCVCVLLYPELEPHLVNPDHTPSEHNPDHAQGPKWTLVTVDRSTHWAPSARVHHHRNTWYLILELTQTRADYCMTHSCNHTTRSTTNKDHLITSIYTVVSVIIAT